VGAFCFLPCPVAPELCDFSEDYSGPVFGQRTPANLVQNLYIGPEIQKLRNWSRIYIGPEIKIDPRFLASDYGLHYNDLAKFFAKRNNPGMT
jgi:hypothetical protein